MDLSLRPFICQLLWLRYDLKSSVNYILPSQGPYVKVMSCLSVILDGFLSSLCHRGVILRFIRGVIIESGLNMTSLTALFEGPIQFKPDHWASLTSHT